MRGLIKSVLSWPPVTARPKLQLCEAILKGESCVLGLVGPLQMITPANQGEVLMGQHSTNHEAIIHSILLNAETCAPESHT